MSEPSDGLLHWQSGDGAAKAAPWRSTQPLPRRLVPADDRMAADQAFRLAAEGTALVWEGDYQNARQLLQALARRLERRGRPRRQPEDLTQAFHLQRQAQAQRARLLGMVALPFDTGWRLGLRRAPDVSLACEQAWGPLATPALVPLRDLLGAIGAYEWRRRGVPVAALDAAIHPHYGVFAPTRGEYIDLLATAPLPAAALAIDVGTGTGVLAAVLARRGVPRVLATDVQPAALACARENLARLGYADRVEVVQADLFPAGVRAGLIVCNPPWLPGKPAAPLEAAIYDPDSRMLRGFLQGARAHLAPEGEAWLILSDLAERLGLRAPNALAGWVAAAGLTLVERHDIRPRHGKARDADDPLHAARAAEITSLWRLRAD
ncbi:class I SAM-dependent methyltransferase [Verticiella sediminum]|uniref:Class I SAM-dependent methyltransferase n=1 Tax=Verticiella sediminum TaxID=1247510 RepID=A0A556AYI4_9BURK|nr:class I SAM-dependent methyltransferase [Verticiella sediminum]TSH97999.1 class I SAM-dependent methyltransferase [Verticiella sediminum]